MTNGKLIWVARLLETLGAVALMVANATSVVGADNAAIINLVAMVVLLGASRVRGWLPAKKGPVGAAIVGLVAIVFLAGCGYAGLARGYQALGMVKMVGNATGRALAKVQYAKTRECVLAHGTHTPEAKACIKPMADRIEQWHLARASINAANTLAYASLLVHHAYLDGRAGGRKLNVLKVIAVSVCGLVKAAMQFKDLIPSKEIVGGLAMVKGLVCL